MRSRIDRRQIFFLTHENSLKMSRKKSSEILQGAEQMRSENEELRNILLKCESTELFDAPLHDVNQKNCFGDTPLHMVVHWGEVENARRLIAAGADLNVQGERGFTPLFYARTVEMARLLISCGANPRICGDEGKLAPDRYIRLLDVADVADFIAHAQSTN